MTSKVGEFGLGNANGKISTEDPRLRCKTAPPPDPALVSEECFSVAEEAAEQVLNCVHLTLDSEEKRIDIIDYVQRLIKNHLNYEVVSYGSVPLKTCLPDGDIDLTVLKGFKAEESLAHDVLTLLKGEEQNEHAEYEVKDTQFIDAEVKLVKCLVRSTVIDISFNQLGGLSTLCFLEKVDRLVGRNHLFKRSIILVKTWCYYESRILGACHGLFSTYALETLILYIFQLFHSSMRGPLAVLYRFLDYYSQFDWENYCISLKGPVCKSCLPDIVVKMPESGCKDLLLSEEFLQNCVEMFSVSSRGLEAQPKAFQTKHLNIVDPLKENNNLGRSIHRGNFYRIQSALKYGAHKLGQILSQPRDKAACEICNFFANTRARHENHYGSNIQRLALEFDDEESLTASLSSPAELFSEDVMPLLSSENDSDNISVCMEETPILKSKNKLDRYSETCCFADRVFILGHCSTGDKNGFETSNSALRNGQCDHISSCKYSASLSDNHCHKPQNFFLKPSSEHGSLEAEQVNLACTSQKFGSSSLLESRDEHVEMNDTYRLCLDNFGAVSITGSSSTAEANILGNPSLCFTGTELMSVEGESEAFNPLADLTGDYDSHIRSFLCGRLCHVFPLFAPLVHNPPSSPSRPQIREPWDIVCESMPCRQNKLSQMNLQRMSAEHSMHPGADSAFLETAFQPEGKPKAQGTGTYRPQMNDFSMEVLGNHNHVHRSVHSNGLYLASGESNTFEYNSCEILPSRSSYRGRNAWNQSPCSVGGWNHINGYLRTTCRIEFGSVGNLAEEVLSGSTYVSASNLNSSPKPQDSRANITRERVSGQSIHLKNEDEFPPLCQ